MIFIVPPADALDEYGRIYQSRHSQAQGQLSYFVAFPHIALPGISRYATIMPSMSMTAAAKL